MEASRPSRPRASGKWYHGTSAARGRLIEESGELLSSADPTGLKGTADERGLIWVTRDEGAARSHMTHRGIVGDEAADEGMLFEVGVPPALRTIGRWDELDAVQAAALDELNLRPYDPITEGTELGAAMHRLRQHPGAPQTYAEILPILGYDAISDETGVAVAAPSLPATRIASSILDEYEAAFDEGYADGMAEGLANPPDEYSELERAAYVQGWREATGRITRWEEAPLGVLEAEYERGGHTPGEREALEGIMADIWYDQRGSPSWAEPEPDPDDGTHRILMVCTGNTSRSAIAGAAGRAMAPPGVEVSSAGTYARGGSPASKKATKAARDLGIDLSRHRSRELSAALLKAADEVWYMTERHADDIKATAPWAAAKLRRLDPNADIADPHGGSTELYGETAEKVVKAVRARMAALRLERARAASRRIPPGSGYHRASAMLGEAG